MRLLLFPLLLLLLFGCIQARKPCAKRHYTPLPGESIAFSCVCDTNFCDDIEPLGTIQKDAFVAYVSSQTLNRLDRIDFHFTGFPNTTSVVKVDASKKFQKVIGFGGAITDSVGINLQSLSANNQDQIMKQYFGSDGLEYVLARVPIASCDFSTHAYSYDDVAGDMDLVHFNLTIEDFKYKIPLIKQARSLVENSGGDFKLFTTAWSAPGWMKDTGLMKGGGKLLGEVNGPYYKTWSNYYKRYFEEYHELGIDFWGVTPGNEPTAGLDVEYGWQALFFDAEMQRDFIRELFGPMLRGSDITKNIKLMIGDDQRYVWPGWADTVLSDPGAAQYVDGLAVHWYGDLYTPESFLHDTYLKHSDRFMLATEACTGFFPWEGAPIFGDWDRADMYAFDIIQDMRNGMAGWVDWNLVVDPTGGPNFAKNNVDAPIIANATTDEFIKQPMFYALGHFSKFVKPDFTRIDLTIPVEQVEGVAFLSPDGAQRVAVFLNRNRDPVDLALQDQKNPVRYGNLHLDAKSIMTVVWNM